MRVWGDIKMIKKIKNWFSKVGQELKTIFESLMELVTAISLCITSGFSIYQGNQSTEWWAWPVTIAGSVIAVLAGLQLVKYLKKRG